MARRTRRATTRRAPARSYRSRSTRAPARRGRPSYRAAAARSTRRTTRRTTARGQTIRIELVQPGSGTVARPEMIGKMPIVGLTRNRSRF